MTDAISAGATRILDMVAKELENGTAPVPAEMADRIVATLEREDPNMVYAHAWSKLVESLTTSIARMVNARRQWERSQSKGPRCREAVENMKAAQQPTEDP